MKKIIRNAFFAAGLVTALLMPAVGLSDMEYVDDQDNTIGFDTKKHLIAEIDNEVAHNIRLRKINDEQQKEIDIWTKDASAWIEQQNRLSQAVNRARQRKGDYATLNRKQLQQEIDDLNNRLISVIKPPGGRMLGNKKYYHIEDAYKEMVVKSKELERLQDQEHKFAQKMLELDARRDELVRKAEKSTGKFIKENRKLLAYLKKVRNRRIEQVNNPDTWCEQQYYLKDGITSPGPFICRDRKMVLIHLAQKYRAELRRTGKPFKAEELAAKVREVQENSNQTKATLKNKAIPFIENAIYESEQLAEAAEIPAIDPSGCWFMWLPGSNRKAVIHIKLKDNAGYEGQIVDHGWLDLPDSHILFKADRINATTFEGTEYSIIKNIRTRTRLRLIIDKGRHTITYRTEDDMVSMTPCN